jgi:hypothetical protein
VSCVILFPIGDHVTPEANVYLVWAGESGQLEVSWILRVEFPDGRTRFVQCRAWHDGGSDMSEAVSDHNWNPSMAGRLLPPGDSTYSSEWVVRFADSLHTE